MKYLILLMFFCFGFNQSKADCLDAMTTCWPSNGAINKNPIIIISGGDTNFLKALYTKYQVYLISGKRKVQLTVVEVFNAGLNLVQLLLKPKEDLAEGQKYGLYYMVPGNSLRPLKSWDSRQQEEIPIAWTVNNYVDNEAPLWKGEPKIIAKFFREGGCGPDIWVHFKFNFFDRTGIVLKAVVLDLKSHTQVSCLIDHKKDVFQLGHSMCWGVYEFPDEKEYEVVFYLLDESGNASIASKPIRFEKPDIPGWSN